MAAFLGGLGPALPSAAAAVAAAAVADDDADADSRGPFFRRRLLLLPPLPLLEDVMMACLWIEIRTKIG